MNKAVLILPFFGKLPNYFQLYLNSCSKNDDYDWIVFTNDETKYEYPQNVKVIYISFENFVKKIQDKFNFEICINTPKKLCDFKPLYGYIFSNEIKEYKYWGYCDCDLIFGKISDFINFEKLSDYAKIGIVGHLAFIRNETKLNEFFKNDILFKNIISNPSNLVYDEGFDGSVNNVLINMGEKIFNIEDLADISCNHSNFRLNHYNFNRNKYLLEKREKGFFVWDNGKIFKYIIKGKTYYKKEYIYIHLQKRSMKVNTTNKNIYKIIPNSFDNLEQEFYKENYKKVKQNHITFHKTKFLCKKIKNKLLRK